MKRRDVTFDVNRYIGMRFSLEKMNKIITKNFEELTAGDLAPARDHMQK